jgi:hypothetical protein
MNCDVLQRHLLGRERPDSPSADAAAHLADCAACREWLLRLVQLERAVIQLPVPPAEAARSALMRRILSREAENGQPAPARKPPVAERRRPSIAMVVGSWIMDPHASPRRRVAAGLVAGVAAALLLFVVGWLVWDGDHPSPQVAGTAPKAPADPLLAELRRYKIDAAGTTEPTERVKVMADAADQVCDRAGAKNSTHEELTALAYLYSRVVHEGIVKSAEGVSAADRRELLEPIASKLAEAESEWHRLALQADLPPSVKTALDRAELAARKGKDKLRELCATA